MQFASNVSFRQTEPAVGLLVGPSGATVSVVNGAGVALCKSLADGGASRSELVATLKTIFDELPNDEKIERDVDAFLDGLRADGFLVENDAK